MKYHWHKHFNNPENVVSGNFQQNVGRLDEYGSQPAELEWHKELSNIEILIELSENDETLELCCGNGDVLGPLSQRCRGATGVDFSELLLMQLKRRFRDIKIFQGDVNDITFPENSFDKIIHYFSLQYFTEKETLTLIKNALSWLNPKGILFIGAIPNELKKWNFYKNEKTHKYYEDIINESPEIGYWYHPDFFAHLNKIIINVEIQIIELENWQLNSSWRFDVLIKKV